MSDLIKRIILALFFLGVIVVATKVEADYLKELGGEL